MLTYKENVNIAVSLKKKQFCPCSQHCSHFFYSCLMYVLLHRFSTQQFLLQ